MENNCFTSLDRPMVELVVRRNTISWIAQYKDGDKLLFIKPLSNIDNTSKNYAQELIDSL